MTITVNAVNDAPTAVDDTYATAQGQALTVTATGVLANDTDVDGDALTAVLVDGPTNGTVALNADGSFEYTPDADFNGADSFTYRANDGQADIERGHGDDHGQRRSTSRRLAADDAYTTAEGHDADRRRHRRAGQRHGRGRRRADGRCWSTARPTAR